MNHIEKMCRDHFNEPVICGFEVVRLIGYGETAVDCYLICSCAKRGVFWNTAVGGYVFLDRLKGQQYIRSTTNEDWDDLFRLDQLLTLNGSLKAPEFILDIRLDDFEGQCNLAETKS